MATTIHIDGFSDRLKELCSDYYDMTGGDTPPIVTSTMERMNSLIAGTRNPTMEELIAISEAYDVSINYLVNRRRGEGFPGNGGEKRLRRKRRIFCVIFLK